MPLGNKASPELKSIDLIPWNSFSAAADAAAQWRTAVAAGGNPLAGVTSPAYVGTSPITALAGSALIFSSVGSSNTPGQLGCPVLLNGISAGYFLNQRIGRKFTMRSLKLDMDVYAGSTQPVTGLMEPGNVAATTSVGYARILLVYDRQCNGAIPQGQDILAPPGSSGIQNLGSGNIATSSDMNLNNRTRFLVIADKLLKLDYINTRCQRVKIYKKLNLQVVNNSATDASAAAIMTGAIWLLAIADSAPSAVYPQNAATQVISTPISFFPNLRIRITDA